MNYFTDREHIILEQICDTFVGSTARQDDDVDYWDFKSSGLDLSSKIEDIAAKLPEKEISDLKKVLKILSSSYCGLLYGGPLKPFDQLSREQKERLFFRWSRSQIGALRKAFNVFRKLSTFMTYSASAQEIPSIHKKIGYIGPISKVSNQPTKINTINAESDQEISCEYLIIGSGAGGGLAAGMLSEAGKDVVLLEKGNFLNENKFNEQEWDMISKLYDRGGAMTSSNGGVTVFAGSCLGGGTTVNWNASFPTPDHILNEWRQEADLAHIESVKYKESAKEVCRLFHVNGDHSSHNPQNQKLWDGAKKLGLNPKVIQRNVSGCNAQGLKSCGYCGFGCIGGCKQGTMRTTIQKASDLGARIYCNTEALTIQIKSGKATGASCIQTIAGKRIKLSIKAENVIVACGAIHTPALLMRSGLHHKELGKNLFFHPTVGIAASYNEKIEPWHGPMMSTVVTDKLRLDGNYGYWLETAPVHPGVIGMTLPWVSREQHKNDFTIAPRCAAFIALTRDRYGGKVSLDKNSCARIKYKMHSYDLNHSLLGMQEAAEIHIAAGAQEVIFPHRTRKTVNRSMSLDERQRIYLQMTSWKWRVNDYALYSAHQMSSCRMGGNSNTHPVRPDGSFVGCSNLFIADGSALPSCPGINPMISIMTLSHYTIKNILNG